MAALLTAALFLQDDWTVAVLLRDGSEESCDLVGADVGGLRVRTRGVVLYYNWFELDPAYAAAARAALDLDADAAVPRIRLHRKDGREIEAATIALTPDGVRIEGVEIPLRDLARIHGLVGRPTEPVDAAEVDRMIRLSHPARTPEGWRSIGLAYLKAGLLTQARAARRAAALVSNPVAVGHDVWTAASLWLSTTPKSWAHDEALRVESLLMLDLHDAALEALRALRLDARWKDVGDNVARPAADLEVAIVDYMKIPYEDRVRHDWSRALESRLLALAHGPVAAAERAVRESLVRDLDSALADHFVPRAPSDTPSAVARKLPSPRTFRYGPASRLRDMPAGADRDDAWDRADADTRLRHLHGLHIETFYAGAAVEWRDGDRVITYR